MTFVLHAHVHRGPFAPVGLRPTRQRGFGAADFPQGVTGILPLKTFRSKRMRRALVCRLPPSTTHLHQLPGQGSCAAVHGWKNRTFL